jgi:pimeloyl-ACP methyl ester carboxylesterase
VSLVLAAAAAEAPQLVSFPSADGGRVFADRYGDGTRSGVVLAHGAVFDKQSWRELAERLAAGGHRVLAIDFRGFGQSVAGSATTKDDRFEDVLAAVRFLHESGVARVAVVGASMGGGAVAEAAARAKAGDIDRLVLLAPAPIAHPEALKGPKLLIMSNDEPAAARLRDDFAKLPDPKRLVVLPGTAHAQHVFRTDQSAALTTAIVEFLAE